MRYWGQLEIDNLGRVEARVLALVERLPIELVTFCSMRLKDRVLIAVTIESEEQYLGRLRALLFRLEGARQVRFRLGTSDADSHVREPSTSRSMKTAHFGRKE
jgi:hypothetical protein